MFGKKLGLTLASVLLLAACGSNSFSSIADKNSDAAKKEDAQIAINKGDYSAAITIMAEKCPNLTCTSKSDTQQYAAAYMGEAGLDVLTVAKNADTSKDSSSSSSDFAVISKGIPAPTAANLQSIANAIAILNNSKSAVGLKPGSAPKAATTTCGTYSNEQKDILLQLGISQATATILTIGSQLGGFDANGLPNDCSGNCTTAASQAAIATALNAAYTPPGGTATTYAAYAAANLVSAATNLSCAFSTDNTTASAINDLAFTVENHTTNNSSTCSQTAPAGYSAAMTGTQVTSYLGTCLK